MANRYSVSRLADTSAAITVARTMLRLVAGANTPVIVTSWWFEFDSVASADKPIRVELLSETTLAAPTGGTTITPLAGAPGFGAALTTAIVAAVTTEGAATFAATAYENHFVPATGGLYIQYPLGREPVVAINLGIRWRVTATTNVVNMSYGCTFEE